MLPTMVFAESLSLDISVLKKPTLSPSDNENHIVYELQIINNSDRDLRLGLVEVADQNDNPVLSYFGEKLKQQSVLYRGKDRIENADMTLSKGTAMFLFFTIALPKTEKNPTQLQNRLFFTQKSESKTTERVVPISYLVEVNQNKPVALNLPLRGADWVASGALSEYSYYRRAIYFIDGQYFLAQRYAIDWQQLCTDGKAVRDDVFNNDNWNSFGQEVFAAADGIVTRVQDNIPNNTPLSSPQSPLSTSQIPGNYVIIKVTQAGQTYYILNAHLQPRSIQVKEGDMVTAGQVIANVGNSGNGTTPHLQFYVMDANDPLKSEGLPFVFNEVNLIGNLKLIDADYGIWKPLIKRNEALSKNILPLDNQLFDFTKEKRFKCP